MNIEPESPIDGVAGYDVDQGVARALIGHYEYDYIASGGAENVAVFFGNLKHVDALMKDGRVRVEADWIRNSGMEPLEKPETMIDADYAFVDDHVSVILPKFGTWDTYTVQLSKPNEPEQEISDFYTDETLNRLKKGCRERS